MHSDVEPIKLRPIERNEIDGASGSSLVENDASDVTEKIQRLNLYFEKENVRIVCYVNIDFVNLIGQSPLAN